MLFDLGGVSCYCLEYLSEVLVDPSSEKDPKQPGFSCSNNNLNELIKHSGHHPLVGRPSILQTKKALLDSNNF